MTKVGGTTTPPDPGETVELFTNGTMEAMEAPNKPQGWTQASWGSNTNVFSVVAGHTSPSAARVELTNYVSGNAKWLSPVIEVEGGTYHYSHWYRSSTMSKVQAEVTMADGSKRYIWIGGQAVSDGWVKISEHITIPDGAVSIRFEHFIESNGWLETDDYSLSLHEH
jgi:hypothetical protein